MTDCTRLGNLAPPPTSLSALSMSSSRPSTQPGGETEEEDDYLTMTFAEPLSPTTSTTKKESLTQATKRKQREAEIRARPKSKAELAAEEASKRDAALARSTLDPSSKGFQMMAKLGYKPGSALGKGKANGDTSEGGGGAGLLEPVGLEMKEGRSGIGADAEKKRKFREKAESRLRVEGEETKRQKVEEGEFRERQRMEREERRRFGQILRAQRVAERLEEEEEQEEDGIDSKGEKRDESGRRLEDRNGVGMSKKMKRKPLSQINVLWRGAVKQRELAERDKRMRYDLHQSLSRLPTYEDADEDKEDTMAFGKKCAEEVDLDLDQDDPELDEFDGLETSDKLLTLVQYLRGRWHYCFWCKYRYDDSTMEGCPGSTEDDHD